ncbi:MAG: T9SS type A sorting domain-containing protein [Bacteroidales bacterium]|nr:T9SS type A sorting domain-containing protein [Bacteroidales bacterium]
MKKSFLVVSMLFAISFSFAQNNMQWQYALRFGGSSRDQNNQYLNYPHKLLLDAEGNAYVFCDFGDGASFYGYYEDYEILDDEWISLLNSCGSFVAKFDCNGNLVWHKIISSSTNRNNQAYDMILKNNRLYLHGTYVTNNVGYTHFLDTTVPNSHINYLEAYDYTDSLTFPFYANRRNSYIMELDLDGNIIDYQLFQLYKENMEDYDYDYKMTFELFMTENMRPTPFAIDNQQNYYMLSHMHFTCHDSLYNIIPQKMVFKHNWEPITDTIMPEDNKYHHNILKFDRDFNLIYCKPLIRNISDPNFYGIDIWFDEMETDSDDNVYITGTAIMRYRHGVEPSLPIDIEFDGNNHVYLTNPDFVPSDDYYTTPSFVFSFLLKMNSQGEILWVDYTKNFGPFGQTEFKNMLLDEPTGNIYISGYAMPKMKSNLDTTLYVNPFQGYSYTIFGENDTVFNNYDGDHAEWINLTYVMACYDTDGNYKWYSIPNSLGTAIGGIAKHNDKLYAGVGWSTFGLTCGDHTYMPTAQLPEGVSGTTVSGFGICEWDMQGNMTDVMQIPCYAQNQTEPYGTCINNFGELYTVGRFDNYMVFGRDSIWDEHGGDLFIAKFGLPCQTYIYDTTTFCYGDVEQGVTLTASGDYTFMYPEGDSVVFVHATVLPPLTIGLNDTTVCTAQQFYLDACGEFDSYQWSTGGTGCTEMLQFDNACTQSVSIKVTQGECSATKTIRVTAQVCDGITAPVTTAMSLYPNPASDMVTIFGDGFVSATVIDLAGRTLLRTTAMTIDISGLRPGEYIVKVERINGETEELKFIKE